VPGSTGRHAAESFGEDEDAEGRARARRCSQKASTKQFFQVFVNVGLQKLEKDSVKPDRTLQDSSWDVSFWFVVTSPLLGILFGFLGVVIFCR